MNIQDLIATKTKQITVLERHIKMLEQMAEEDAGGRPGVLKAGATGGGLPPRTGRRRRRRGASRASQIEKYLQAHRGPQPAKAISSALGFKPAEVHSAVNSGLKTGRFSRGKQRATYGLGSRSGTKPAVRVGKKRRKGPAKGKRRGKGAAEAKAATASA